MNLTKTPYLVLFTILIAIGISSAYAVTITIAGDLKLDGLLLDNTNSAGTSGQFLTSTGSGVEWTSTAPGSGTVTSVGSGTGLTGGPITSTGSLSIDTAVVPQLGAFNTFQNDMTVDGNLLVSEGSFTVDQQAFFNNNIDLTGTSDADDDTIFFDVGTSEFLQWEELGTRFVFSDALQVQGDLDVFEGSITTNIDANIGNNLNVDGDIDLSGTDPGDNDRILFDDSSAILQWSEGNDQFEFSRKLDVNGGLNVREGTFTAADAAILSGDASIGGNADVTGNLAVGGVASGITWNSRVPQSTSLTLVDFTGDVGRESSITIGTDGLPVISYGETFTTDLNVLHCGNASCSSGNIITVVDSSVQGRDSSITIGTDGFPVISYRDDGNSDLKVAHCTNTSCSTFDTPTTVASTGFVGFDTSITIGTDGFPVISYGAGSPDFDLMVVHCTNTSCSTSEAPTAVDSTGSVGADSSIIIGTDGFPVISYINQGNSDLKVVHCTNTSCSASEAPTIVDPSVGSTDIFSSITIGTDGFPVISYRDGSTGDLQVVHCTNTSCSSSTITIVDSAVDVGATSITIGTDGFPMISYHDQTNQALKVVHCTNISCSTSDTPTILDNTADNGDESSIAIGTDGLPVISYYNGPGSNDLKVAKCTNPYCIDNWIRR